MAVLFSADDLSDHLRVTVDEVSAESVERVVWGWLMGATGLTERPDPVPDDLFSWALELGAMAYDNPTSLTVRQVDDTRMEQSEERREAILRAASSASNLAGSGRAVGSFPCAKRWPDPAGYGTSAYCG